MSENDPFDGPAIGRITVRPVPMTGAESSLPVVRALQSSVEYLLGLQNPEGFWVGELEADSSLESDAILLDYFLGNPQPERIRKLANCIREQQSPDGGWQLYPGGPPNVSLIIKAYLALRLAGAGENDPALRKAERLALELGGVEATNSFTKIYLCLLGQYDWNWVPAIPPELVLLPKAAYFNIYEMSCWTRAILVPL